MALSGHIRASLRMSALRGEADMPRPPGPYQSDATDPKRTSGQAAIGRALSPTAGFAMLAEMNPAPVKPTISLDYIGKIDIRVGTILTVEDVMHSEKLVRLKVDFGDHQRTILVGMKKERQNPKAEIEGKQALFVVNIEPRKMAGEISEGMIFDLGYADGITPVLALPEKAVPDGTRAG
jgi:tRNA-binding protein